MTEIDPIFVVLGRDAQGKPHASRFADADVVLAAKAAKLMGYDSVRVEESSLRGPRGQPAIGQGIRERPGVRAVH